MTAVRDGGDMTSVLPDLSGISLAELPFVGFENDGAVVEQAVEQMVKYPERERQEQEN